LRRQTGVATEAVVAMLDTRSNASVSRNRRPPARPGMPGGSIIWAGRRLMRLKFPEQPREALQVLALLDDKHGLGHLLDRIDWRGVSPRQIYLALLGRLPESMGFAIGDADYSPRNHAESAYLSGEFQEQVITRALSAYAEKQRLLFVHIPKCAGTDLIENLSANQPWLNQNMSRREWTPAAVLLPQLKRFVIHTSVCSSIFVSGHLALSWYLDRGL
jgi:hypothetical protein